mmetsp:Transcript_17713/g.20923  ORF Transcript_17713/g.20923 Transcript_17713/m.20923 type:complete len:115 (-) Transcript_17713:538-882(-)
MRVLTKPRMLAPRLLIVRNISQTDLLNVAQGHPLLMLSDVCVATQISWSHVILPIRLVLFRHFFLLPQLLLVLLLVILLGSEVVRVHLAGAPGRAFFHGLLKMAAAILLLLHAR